MFFDWKKQLEKVQPTRDLKDVTILYQGIRLPCKIDRGYCDPITRTQTTIVWFTEETCTNFHFLKKPAQISKLQKYTLK